MNSLCQQAGCMHAVLSCLGSRDMAGALLLGVMALYSAFLLHLTGLVCALYL
jgi:hypothetical protein